MAGVGHSEPQAAVDHVPHDERGRKRLGASSASVRRPRALAADGHRVVLVARRADRIQAVADELGDGALAIEADVTDRDAPSSPPGGPG